MKIHKRSIIFGIIVGTILLAATWFFTRPQGSIELALAPGEMQMKNGEQTQTVKHKQTIKLSPGIYELSFGREDFSSVKKTVTIEKGETSRVVVALTPQTEAAEEILRNSPDSQSVIKEFKESQYAELINTLPIAGVGYSISACQSLRQPKSDQRAICIDASTASAEQAATQELARLGYAVDELELLVGPGSSKTVLRRDSFMVEYYTNTELEHSEKPALFVTPLDVPFVAFNAPRNTQLETIKTEALAAIEDEGYDLKEYDIFYSNVYLSKYNPSDDDHSEHAMPPIQP